VGGRTKKFTPEKLEVRLEKGGTCTPEKKTSEKSVRDSRREKVPREVKVNRAQGMGSRRRDEGYGYSKRKGKGGTVGCLKIKRAMTYKGTAAKSVEGRSRCKSEREIPITCGS